MEIVPGWAGLGNREVGLRGNNLTIDVLYTEYFRQHPETNTIFRGTQRFILVDVCSEDLHRLTKFGFSCKEDINVKKNVG